MPTYLINKRAKFDYELLEYFEGGLVLFGYEVKSLKTGGGSLKGAFVTIKDRELYLTNAHIPAYQEKNTPTTYDPYRSRKVLIRKKDINTLIGKIQQKGLTLVPIRLYSKRRLIKLEFAIGKGKKKIDKRESIKKRETAIQMRRVLRGDKNSY